MLRFCCPRCSKKLKAPNSALGRRVKCIYCNEPIEITSSIVLSENPSQSPEEPDDAFAFVDLRNSPAEGMTEFQGLASSDIVFPANDFATNHKSVRIVRVQNKYFIEDNSGGGKKVFVNNVLVQHRIELQNGDKIRIGDVIYTFYDGNLVLPLETSSEPSRAGDENEGVVIKASITSEQSDALLNSQPPEKIRVIKDLTNNLSNTAQLDSLLPKIVDSLFALFKQADRGFIILRQQADDREKLPEKLIPKVIKTRFGQNESATGFSKTIARECLKTAQAILSDNAIQETRWNNSQSIAEFRIISVMCAPLWTQNNKAFGVIQLDTQNRSKKFTQDDLRLLMAVAKQASLAIQPLI